MHACVRADGWMGEYTGIIKKKRRGGGQDVEEDGGEGGVKKKENETYIGTLPLRITNIRSIATAA